MIVLMLRSCCTGVVGQDTQKRSYRQVRHVPVKVGMPGNDAMFLIGLFHIQARMGAPDASHTNP